MKLPKIMAKAIGGVIVALIMIAGIFLVVEAMTFTSPPVMVQDLDFSGFDEDRKGFTLDLVLSIENPNIFELKIIGITGDIYIDDSFLGDLDNETGNSISGHGSGEIRLSIHISDEGLRIHTGSELRVKGSATVKYLIFQKESPFQESKSLMPGDDQTQKFPPVAFMVGPHSARVLENVQFSGAGSFDKDGEIVSYNWDLGDGSTADTVEVLHRYTNVGVYRVTLTVTDNEEKTGTAIHEIVVSVIP